MLRERSCLLTENTYICVKECPVHGKKTPMTQPSLYRQTFEPEERTKTLLSWSSGKDSAWALHVLQSKPDTEVLGLFTTINEQFDRVSMHAVRTALLKLQALSAGLPLQLIPIPYPCSDAQYEDIMRMFVEQAKHQGVTRFAFGDLYLEDIRNYRESRLAGTGITPVFPLWGMPTADLSRDMIDGGLRAKITCVDPRCLSPGLVGSEYDRAFLEALPPDMDPCGENGEFHSFVYDGPMFHKPVSIRTGETLTRDGFVFMDMLPDEHRPAAVER